MSNKDQPTILIAEDDTILQELYKEACDTYGIRCIQCYEGLETWDTLEDMLRTLDVIILDIMLPGLSGEGILARLRKKMTNHPPVIVVSAIAESKGNLDEMAPGGVVYIVKGDVSLRTILAAILKYTGHEQPA